MLPRAHLHVWATSLSERRIPMQKYITPEMKTLDFEIEDSINAPVSGQKLFNDGTLVW